MGSASLHRVAALCLALVTGCADSGLLNRVADQSAQIAKLEVDLGVSEKAVAAANSQLREVSARLRATEDTLATTEKSVRELESSKEDLAQQLSLLKQRSDAANAQLAAAQKQIRVFEDERNAREAEQKRLQEKLRIIGTWDRNHPSCRFIFNEDGSGSYHASPYDSRVDSTLTYSMTETPGVFEIIGKVRTRGRDDDGSEVRGIFTVNPDAKTGSINGWDTNDVGKGIYRRSQ